MLATTRTDGSSYVSPVWFRWTGEAFEVVIALGDVTEIRRSIAGRYLGPEAGERFAAERASKPGVLLRLVPVEPRVWDLEDILPR